MRVIDSHAHWWPSVYFELMCARDGFPRAVREGDGYRCFKQEGRGRPVASAWVDLDRQWADMDATGHEITMVSSMGPRSDLDGLPAGEAREAAIAINEAYAGAQVRYPERFLALAAVPLQDTRAAIEVLDDAIGRLDLRGVAMPGSIGPEPIDAPRLEDFYARVEELGVPLFFHPTDATFSDLLLPGYEGALYYSVGRMMDSSVAVLRLILSGLLDRHPHLKVVHYHVGGILPYIAGRLDKNIKLPGLAEPPSAYLERMWTDTVAPRSESIRFAVDFYGGERVMYGSDYPCWTPDAALAALDGAALGANATARILGSNIGDVLRLEAPVTTG